MQRIFNCDKIQDNILTLDKVLNSLIHGSPFCVMIYTSYKLSKYTVFIGPPCICHDCENLGNCDRNNIVEVLYLSNELSRLNPLRLTSLTLKRAHLDRNTTFDCRGGLFALILTLFTALHCMQAWSS